MQIIRLLWSHVIMYSRTSLFGTQLAQTLLFKEASLINSIVVLCTVLCDWYYLYVSCVQHMKYLLVSPESPSTSINLYNYVYAFTRRIDRIVVSLTRLWGRIFTDNIVVNI